MFEVPDAPRRHSRLSNGKIVYTPIEAEEGTAEFDRRHSEIMSGKHFAAKTSWDAPIGAMRETDKWTNFSPRYRKDLEPIFEYIGEKIGCADVAWLTQADIYDAMEKNKHRVRFAN